MSVMTNHKYVTCLVFCVLVAAAMPALGAPNPPQPCGASVNASEFELIYNKTISSLYYIRDVACSPDGKYIAVATNATSSGSTSKIKLYWVSDGTYAGNYSDGVYDSYDSIAFSPDGTMLAGGKRDTTVRLFNTATHGLIGTFRGSQLC